MTEEEKYHDYLNNGPPPEASDQELLEFLENASKAHLPKGKRSKEDLWQAIDEKLEEEKEGKTLPISPKWIFGIAAAIALLILALPQILKEQPAASSSFTAALGETQQIELPDASTVTLNAGSELTFQEGEERLASLKGEGFFSVKKGKPFVVQTDNGTVRVLGTSFNVKTRGEQLEVTCKTGKVQVVMDDIAIKEDLNPGEGLIKEEDTVRRLILTPDLIGKWQTGEFYFENRPLSSVLDELGRQFNVVIEAEAADEKRFTGYFTTENLELALTIICEPLGLQYEIVGASNVIISSQ